MTLFFNRRKNSNSNINNLDRRYTPEQLMWRRIIIKSILHYDGACDSEELAKLSTRQLEQLEGVVKHEWKNTHLYHIKTPYTGRV